MSAKKTEFASGNLRRIAVAGVAAIAVFGLMGCSGGPSPIDTLRATQTSEPTSSEEPPSPTATTVQGPEAINGRWRSVSEESDELYSRFTIELPNVIYDDGTTEDITAHGPPLDLGNGVFQYDVIDAPFGTYYPAGIPAENFDTATLGKDLIDKDRIYSSQSGLYKIRE